MKYILFLYLFTLSSCQLQEANKTHGINFLENRNTVLIVDKTNKNDVLKIFGNAHAKSISNENTWFYFERRITRGKMHKLGKNVLDKNNILELEFSKFGVLTRKKIYTKKDMVKVKYSEEKTTNTVQQDSFVSKFLSSVKQKMYSNKKF